jgi:cell division transport system permease protein
MWELRFCLREAFKGVRRNPFLSIASTLTAGIAMLVFALFLTGAANLSHLADHVEGQLQVSVFLVDGLTAEQRASLASTIGKVDGVGEVSYVPKSEALARLRESLGDNAPLLDGIEEFNPLRDAIEVQVTEAASVEAVVAAVEGSPHVAEVSYGKELVARLLSVTRLIRTGALVAAALLGVATLFLVQNSIRLSVFARRDEVAIMRLVGATDAVIRWPFIFEGLSLAGLGAILAISAVTAAYAWAARFAALNLVFLPFLSVGAVMQWVGPAVVSTGAATGAVGAVFALRRWLSA